MQKPTIFVSHSSLDKGLISQIKKLLLNRTSRTLDIFQSSDGESIPFGNNWVHQVEENLRKSKLMFVFVSPRSAMSSWIYFEAGFAYSMGVKVIPIGIDGIDVGSLKPPLNLLQGFNIASAEGLNNMIAVLNRELDCDYTESFDQKDFELLSAVGSSKLEGRSEVLEIIDFVKFFFPHKIEAKKVKSVIVDDPLSHVENLLNEGGIAFRYGNEKTIHTHGAIISFKEGDDIRSGITVIADPYCLSINEKLINGLCGSLYGDSPLEKHWLNAVFDDDVSLVTKDFKVSSRLYIHGLEMSDLNGRFHKYESLDFAFDPPIDKGRIRDQEKENLRVIYDARKFESRELYLLIEELMNARVVVPPKNS